MTEKVRGQPILPSVRWLLAARACVAEGLSVYFWATGISQERNPQGRRSVLLQEENLGFPWGLEAPLELHLLSFSGFLSVSLQT